MGTIDLRFDIEVKQKFIDYFSEVAELTSKLSTAKRLQVGAIIVKDNRIISVGYNGMPSGWDNECETWHSNVTFHVTEEDRNVYGTFKTKPEVLHAEANAITKVAKSTESSEGATLFCTHTPCIECAKLIYQSGISELYINNYYESSKGHGAKFLQECNITVTYLN